MANINRFIKESGIEQKEIAAKLGMSPQAITNWMQGRNTPDIEALARLCAVLKVPLDTMLGVEHFDNAKKPAIQEDDGPGDVQIKKLLPLLTQEQKMRLYAVMESLLPEGTLRKE